MPKSRVKLMGIQNPKMKNDEDWNPLDSWVKSWFYNVCDSNLFQIIIRDDCPAKDLWDELSSFLIIKCLECSDFKSSFEILNKVHCHTLKNLANALGDVNSPINDIQLEMQIFPNFSNCSNNYLSNCHAFQLEKTDRLLFSNQVTKLLLSREKIKTFVSSFHHTFYYCI